MYLFIISSVYISWYIYNWNLQFLSNVIINQPKVLLHQVTLDKFGYPV
jgi:hypothetical protein